MRGLALLVAVLVLVSLLGGHAAAHGARAHPAAALAGQEPPPFTGEPVSLDFQNADLRAVLRTFARISGLNVVIDPQVDGVVDVFLTDIPWDQALDVILRTNRLG